MPRARSRDTTVPAGVDVLILGGGPAGTLGGAGRRGYRPPGRAGGQGFLRHQRRRGRRGNNLWYLPPGYSARRRAIAAREEAGGQLTDRDWMARILERTWETVGQLADWGYPFR
jgi:hypothetical protein